MHALCIPTDTGIRTHLTHGLRRPRSPSRWPTSSSSAETRRMCCLCLHSSGIYVRSEGWGRHACMHAVDGHACHSHEGMELGMAGITHITISSFAVSARIRATHASSHRLGCGIASRQQLPLLPLLMPPLEAPQRSSGRCCCRVFFDASTDDLHHPDERASERVKGWICR